MAYETDTAANHLDLLARIRDFLTTNTDLVSVGQEWAVVGGVDAGAIASGDFVSLKGPGLGGTDQIFLTIKAHTNAPAGIYSLQMRGHTAYNEAVPSDTPPGLNSDWVYLPLINEDILYWIVANGRRFICIAKSNNRYDVFYGGFILPEHLPSDWSYPMLIGGSAQGLITASQEGPNHRNFWNCYDSARMFTPAQIWRSLQNVNSAENGLNDSNILISIDWKDSLSFSNKARAIDGSPYIQAGRIAEISNVDTFPRNYLGVYDGVFYTPSVGAVVEQIIEHGGKDYLVVSNVFRNSDNQLAAICLE